MPTSIKAILESYRVASEKLRAYLADKVSLLPDNSDITRLGSGCFSVSLGAIKKNPDLVLDPCYYDFEYQKNVILGILDSGASFELQLKALREIAESGKRTVNGHNIRFHPDVSGKIREILSTIA